MKSNLYAIVLLGLSLSVSYGQSKFDIKKKTGSNTVAKPKFKSHIIDGRKQTNNQRNAPKGNVKNNISDLLNNARLVNPFKSIRVSKSPKTGLPDFITTEVSDAKRKSFDNYDKKEAAYSYLEQLAKVTGISNPQDFLINQTLTDEQGFTHIRMSQTFSGYKIHGAEVIAHLDKQGNGKAFNGRYHVLANKTFKASLSSQKAIDIALDDLDGKTKFAFIPEFHQKMLEYNGPQIIDTLIYQDKTLLRAYTLAYQISIRPNVLEEWQYFIDANTGEILDGYKTSCHIDGPKTATASDLNNVSRTINTYQFGSTYYLMDASKTFTANSKTTVDTIFTLDAKGTFGSNFKVQNITSTNNTNWNKTAVSAHYNAGVAFDYYKNNHNRNAIDGNGGTIYSIINVVDEDGTGLDNAYWNGKAMFYGNGNTAFKPLAGSIDVAGHEMTHGVVQNTANLEYKDESGAINESMADIFGCMMDSSNWLIGEQVTLTSSFPSGALRSLSNPHNGGSSLNDNGWQPKHTNEMYKGTSDNGGVHINSGIPNHAFYLYATALNSRKRAANVFYNALTVYLTKSSGFLELRKAVIQSAKDKYGDGSTAVTEAMKAFDAVGILDGQTNNNNDPVISANPGDELMLCYDTSPTDTDGLYAIGTNIAKILTTVGVYNKPSITDDGQNAVFVGTDQKLHTVQTDVNLATYKESIIQDDPIWSSVAISKDGNRLAAVTLDHDSAIWVFDFDKNEWAKFHLYNPTFTNGITSDNSVYADGLDWDYTGQFIVYDVWNVIPNTTTGENLEYWDIGMINVWDNTTKDFTKGDIFKLISGLEPGESIGNPAFSKTSPNIIAFDYEAISNGTATYAEIGMNLETNKLDLIAENNTLGYPTYNKTDTRLAFGVQQTTTNYDINYVELNADKISSNGTTFDLITGAKWGVYYAIGERDTQVGLLDGEVASNIEIHPNPTKGILVFPSNIKADEVMIFDKQGKAMHQFDFNASSNSIDVSKLPSDLYLLKIKGFDQTYTAKFSKED